MKKKKQTNKKKKGNRTKPIKLQDRPVTELEELTPKDSKKHVFATELEELTPKGSKKQVFMATGMSWIPPGGISIPLPKNADELANEFAVCGTVVRVGELLQAELNIPDHIMQFFPMTWTMLALVCGRSRLDPNRFTAYYIFPVCKSWRQKLEILMIVTSRLTFLCGDGKPWDSMETWAECWVAAERALLSLRVPLLEQELSGGVNQTELHCVPEDPPIVENTSLANLSSSEPDNQQGKGKSEDNGKATGMDDYQKAESPLLLDDYQKADFGVAQSPNQYIETQRKKILSELSGLEFMKCLENPCRFVTYCKGATSEERVGGICYGKPLESEGEYSVQHEAYFYPDDVMVAKEFFPGVD